jgi:SAM-dependent methyltransferase
VATKNYSEIFNQQSQAWTSLGVLDPWWSVLAGAEFRLTNITDEAKVRFYSSGVAYMEQTIMDIFQRAGVPFPKGELAIDYGCGLGRCTFAMMDKFDRVVGIDISEEHLDIARKKSDADFIENVDFIAVNEDLQNIPSGASFIHSVLCFQHIHPIVAEQIMAKLANSLEDGGIILFQTATYHALFNEEDYTFNNCEMVTNNEQFEIYPMSQKHILKIFHRNGCAPLFVDQMDFIGGGWGSHFFMFVKRGTCG